MKEIRGAARPHLPHFPDGDGPLGHFELAPAPRERQDGVARDARQDRAVQRRRHQLPSAARLRAARARVCRRLSVTPCHPPRGARRLALGVARSQARLLMCRSGQGRQHLAVGFRFAGM